MRSIDADLPRECLLTLGGHGHISSYIITELGFTSITRLASIYVGTYYDLSNQYKRICSVPWVLTPGIKNLLNWDCTMDNGTAL